jgi:hypothetical protein
MENLHPDERAYKKLAVTGKQSSEIECPVICITGFLRQLAVYMLMAPPTRNFGKIM